MNLSHLLTQRKGIIEKNRHEEERIFKVAGIKCGLKEELVP